MFTGSLLTRLVSTGIVHDVFPRSTCFPRHVSFGRSLRSVSPSVFPVICPRVIPPGLCPDVSPCHYVSSRLPFVCSVVRQNQYTHDRNNSLSQCMYFSSEVLTYVCTSLSGRHHSASHVGQRNLCSAKDNRRTC